MIKHIVFWKINQGGTETDREATVNAFRQKTEYLQTIIPEIKDAKVGHNLNGGSNFHVCIDSVFEDLDSLNRYINNPEHLKVRAFMNTVSYDKTVFDYEF